MWPYLIELTYLIELIIFGISGVLCIIFGWQIWKKQKIQLIHDYQHQRVSPEDKPAYTEKMGKAVIIIGAGALATGAVNFLFCTFWGVVLFCVAFGVGMAIMAKAQKKYNGGFF